MVQLWNLPAQPSASNQIGQALGAGLSSGIEKGADVGFQRGMLQNALKGLENIPTETTPGQLAQKIMFATAGIPGAERYVDPLYKSLMTDLASRQKAQSQIGASEQQGRVIKENFSPDSAEGLRNLLGEKYFPDIQRQEPVAPGESLKPQKPLVPPEPIGLAQESKIRKQLIENGINNPQVIDETIQKAKNLQTERYAAQKEGFSNMEDYQKAKQARDQNFFQESDLLLGEAHGIMTPNEQSIWKELSRQYEDLPNTERFANTEQLYNSLVGNPVIQFEANQKGLPYGSFFRPEEIRSRMDDARTSVQDHLKRIDERTDLSPNLKGIVKNHLRDQYFNSMVSKDFGIAQAANAVSNLSKEASTAIQKAPAPTEHFFEDIYLSDPKVREQYTYKLANSLTKLKPEDSLILMREKALEQNYDDKAFNQALNLAIQSGNLRLSDFQAQERNKLSIPQRLDLDSVMEGNRNFFDIFKGKK